MLPKHRAPSITTISITSGGEHLADLSPRHSKSTTFGTTTTAFCVLMRNACFLVNDIAALDLAYRIWQLGDGENVVRRDEVSVSFAQMMQVS